jgi:hypothetical protein
VCAGEKPDEACACRPLVCAPDECGARVPDGCGGFKTDCPPCGPACTDAASCPEPPDLCQIAVCVAGFCETDPKDCGGTSLPSDCQIAVCELATGDCKVQDKNDGERCNDGVGYCFEGVCGDCFGQAGCAPGESCCGGACIGGPNDPDSVCCEDVICPQGRCDPVSRACCDVPCATTDVCCPVSEECELTTNNGVTTGQCIPAR